MSKPRTEAEKALEVYHRTRMEALARRILVDWSPSVVDYLAALGDPDGVLAAQIAAWEAREEALKAVLGIAMEAINGPIPLCDGTMR